MAILLNMPIKSLDGDIAKIVKESLVKCEHMSSLILIFNGVLNRLLLVFQSVCIQFTALYVRIKIRVVQSFITCASDIKERESTALLKPLVS